jgi:hypothetical protein
MGHRERAVVASYKRRRTKGCGPPLFSVAPTESVGHIAGGVASPKADDDTEERYSPTPLDTMPSVGLLGDAGRSRGLGRGDEAMRGEWDVRLARVESTLRTIEKQLVKLEGTVVKRGGSKMLNINYDIGDDATIDSK